VNLKILTERFAQLQLRERRLIVLASVIGVVLIAALLLIEPVFDANKAKRNALAGLQTESATLQTQLAGLRVQAADPDAGLKRDLEEKQKQLAEFEAEFRAASSLLVQPAQMPQLLQSLLSKHKGLELVRVRTLRTTPVALASNRPAGTPPARDDKPALGIYRHAFEVTVAGSYADLTAYADELRQVSPRPLWSAMSLKVTAYPRSEMTFTLYTLSLDLPWLAV
jgi:MSHA biogenesis protein MshJ